MATQKSKRERIAVVVLGMHRSGTSMLAGILGKLGCRLPKNLMPTTADNAEGYFEPEHLHALHKRLLDSAGSHWSDWLPISERWFDSPLAEDFNDEVVDHIRSEFGTSRQFVLKDPRICRLVPFWEQVFTNLKISPRYVHIHRDPLEVAASLKKRDALETELSMLIWLRHSLDAEAGTRGKQRCFTSYPAVLQSWGQVVQKIESELDLKLPRLSPNTTAEIESFVRSDLKHHTSPKDRALKDPLVIGWVRDTYEILEKWAEQGEDAKDFPRLDGIREEMDRMGPVFAQIVQSGQTNAHNVRRLTTDKKGLEQQVNGFEQKLGGQDQKIGALEQQLKDQELQSKAQEEKSREQEGLLEKSKIERAENLQKISALEQQLKDQELQSKAQEEKSREQEGLLEKSKIERAENLQKISALEQSHKEEVEEHGKTIAQLREEISRFPPEIFREQQAEIKILKEELHAINGEREKAAKITKQQEDNLKSQLSASELRIRDLNRTIGDYRREVANMTGILVEKEKSRQTMMSHLQKEVIVPGKPVTDQDFTDGLAALRQNADSLRRKTAEQENYISELLDSTSWRVTAPMRRVSGVLRRMVRRG